MFYLGFPCGSVVNYLPAIVGDTGVVGLVPGLGRAPKGGNGSPLQYSCLGNVMDRGAWWATAHEVTEESDTTEQLSMLFFFKVYCCSSRFLFTLDSGSSGFVCSFAQYLDWTKSLESVSPQCEY